MMHVVAEGVQLIQPNAKPCTAQFHREGLRILVDSLLCFHAGIMGQLLWFREHVTSLGIKRRKHQDIYRDPMESVLKHRYLDSSLVQYFQQPTNRGPGTQSENRSNGQPEICRLFPQ